MVTLQSKEIADAVQNTIQSRDIGTLVALGVSTAGSVMVADRIEAFVRGQISLPGEPGSLTYGLTSAGIKGATAAVFGLAAQELTGLPRTLATFAFLGAATSGGADLIAEFVEMPELTNKSRRVRGSRNRNRARSGRLRSSGSSSSSSTTTSTRSSSPSSNGTAAAQMVLGD